MHLHDMTNRDENLKSIRSIHSSNRPILSHRNNPMKIRSILVLAILLGFTSSSYAAVTIAGGNGSFETTTAPTNEALNWWNWGLEDFTINGWTVTKPDGFSTFNPATENAPWLSNGLTGMGTASNGQFFVNVEGGVKWLLSAPITGLTVGNTYTVYFDTRIRSGGGAGDFDVSVNTTVPVGGFDIKPTTTDWIQQSFTFVANSTSHTLTISNQDTSGVGFMVDNFSVVPEPSAALLGGLGMLALLRRRRA